MKNRVVIGLTIICVFIIGFICGIIAKENNNSIRISTFGNVTYDRMDETMKKNLEKVKNNITLFSKKLEGFSAKKIVKRGF